jgi:hypothetical protein
MRSIVVRYEAKPERAVENRGLIEAVFAELKVTQPENIRYMVLELEDGMFIHFAITPDDPAANPLRQNAAFQAFSANGEERQMYKPLFKKAEVVGSYKMLGEEV